MKSITGLCAATAALGLVSLAWAAGPEDQAAQGPQPQTMAPQAEQPMPQQQEQQQREMQQSESPAAAQTASSGTHLAELVPPGMTTQEACTGFKSVKECATALHASQNLNIPFADLKGKLTGGQRLGAAIHTLKPEANARAEVKRAEGQAEGDLHGSRG
jgi:hypothetical protein